MKRLVIYAHYDAQHEVKRYVLHYLRALRPHCERLDFVSTAELSATERGKLDGLCDSAALRENFGFDFTMWRYRLELTDLDAWDEIVLTNSSVLGPVFPLAASLSRVGECDFWGMTENVAPDWHLQSYFLAFRRSVLRSEVFRRYWSGVLPYRSKFEVIRTHEIGLSQRLREAGFQGRASFPSRDVLPRPPLDRLLLNTGTNLTCAQPLLLLRAGMPLVKVEMLRDNPSWVWLAPVLAYLRWRGFDLSLVEFDRPPLAHFMRLCGGRLGGRATRPPARPRA